MVLVVFKVRLLWEKKEINENSKVEVMENNKKFFLDEISVFYIVK